MNNIPKTNIDLSKITGKFPLLGLFLLVVEALLGFWLFLADSTVERMTAGFFMTVIFGSFLAVLVRLSGHKEMESETISAEGLEGGVTPANEEASETEIETPEPQVIVSPDRSYIINKPPDDWIVSEMNMSEWIASGLGITDPSVKEKFIKSDEEVKEILTLQTSTDTSLIPVPGKTSIDGRKVLSALESIIPTRLAILPIDRAQPPFYIERSITHHVMTLVGVILNVGVIPLQELSSGSLPKSGRRYVQAEFSQAVENAIVNAVEGKSLKINIIVIGIEGEVRDYLLIMNYPSQAVEDDPEQHRNLQILRSLVNSFRPARVVNSEEKRIEIKNKVDQKFEKFMTKNGENMFLNEFFILVLRLSDSDMNDSNQRLRAINLLRHFEMFAKEINLQDEDLDSLWGSLQDAEKGNATDFKKSLNKLIELMKGKKEGADLPQLPTADDAAIQGGEES